MIQKMALASLLPGEKCFVPSIARSVAIIATIQQKANAILPNICQLCARRIRKYVDELATRMMEPRFATGMSYANLDKNFAVGNFATTHSNQSARIYHHGKDGFQYH